MTLIALVIAALAAAGEGTPPPDLRRDAEGRLIVESPDRGMSEYRLDFGPGALDYTGAAARLVRLIGPNPFEIVSEDKATGIARVRMTVHGAYQLWNGSSWKHLRPLRIEPGATPQRPKRCTKLLLTLGSDGTADGRDYQAHDEAFCPPAQYVDGLVIQGLDGSGRELWMTTVPDERVVRPLMGPNGEGHGAPVTVPDAKLTAFVTVPEAALLARVRWFEVDGSNRLRQIGEMAWPMR